MIFRVKVSWMVEPIPFPAVIVILKVLPLSARGGVPAITAVPLRPALNVMPFGSAPRWDNFAAG